MRNKVKPLIIILILFVIGSFTAAYIMWNKPQRKVENEEGIKLTAAQLVRDYQSNEAEANKKYLDKALQVTGSVAAINNNQDGNATVTLASDDAFTGVFCTIKEKPANVAVGKTVVIKGICSGMLSDVRLREAVIVNK